MVRLHRLLVPVASVLALSGCMSIGGLGGYPGGGYPDGSSYPGQGYPPQQGYGQSIVGNVDQTDHGNGRFTVADGAGGSATFTLSPTSAATSTSTTSASCWANRHWK